MDSTQFNFVSKFNQLDIVFKFVDHVRNELEANNEFWYLNTLIN